ncbi:MAG: Mov34/MPN/PAD-1 family protein [Bacteriovorax sp.]|nr:Mov34/MPN/PAD-1 family protein [Bacteriovorax sp.]
MPRIKFSSDCKRYSLLIRSEHLQEIYQYCRVAKDNETGGMIIGLYDKNGSIAMTKGILGPTPDSRFGNTWFYRGVSGLKQFFNNLWTRDSLHLLGEWHFHPGGSPDFSHVDIKQIEKLAMDEKYNCSTPILLIVGESKNIFSIGVYVLASVGKLIILK